MTADNIRELLHGVPFVIHLPDRPAARIAHPDFAVECEKQPHN